jgi:hypothetical protein
MKANKGAIDGVQEIKRKGRGFGKGSHMLRFYTHSD